MNARQRQLAGGIVWWGLLALCAWLYWPGLHGPFLLDDAVNLRHLESLDTSAGYLGDIIAGNISGPLGRPVSMLSFAFTYGMAGTDPFVFKMHNLVLHLITACVVYWFAFLVARRCDVGSSAAFACCVAALWMLSPLLLSTVLYAVQRMTQLAALFVLGALVAYCKGREAWSQSRLISMLAMSAAAGLFVAAILSKENALVAIPLVLLTETGVYRPAVPSPHYIRGERYIVLGVCAVGVTFIVALVSGHLAALLGYSGREFTMAERVLTQGRVLWDYTTGFLLPMDRGFGLMHDDFFVSRSLISPPSTALALGGLALATMWSCWKLLGGRRDLVAYGVLFFLAGHLIESTIFPLELYFEHRNYLPAVGLAMAFVHALTVLGKELPAMQVPVRMALVGVPMAAAISLGIQATWWSNEYLLGIRNIEEHPLSQRATVNMAALLATSGFPSEAAALSDAGADLGRVNAAARELRKLGLYCMAGRAAPNIIFDRLEEEMHQLSDAAANEALQVVVNHAVDGKCDMRSMERLADVMFNEFQVAGYMTGTVAASMAKVENLLERYHHALVYAEYLRSRNPRDATANLMSMYFSWLLGDDKNLKDVLEQLQYLECEGALRNEDADVYRQFAKSANIRFAGTIQHDYRGCGSR